MKRKILVSMIILALALMALGPSVGLAAYAYQVQFTTFITYQNIGSATTQTLDIYLYENKDDTTPLIVSQPNLAKDASTSVSVGSLGAPEGFQGTAVLSADQPLAATGVQNPPAVAVEPNVRNRGLSNGFSGGTEDVLVASVLKNYGQFAQITKLGVQNAGDAAVSVTFKFYGTSATPVHQFSQTLQPGAGYQVDASTITQLPTGFIGSASLETTGGSIVASAFETDSLGYGLKAFEGIGAGATTVYMPSALCNFNAGLGAIQTSFYAIQNTSPSTNANVTVHWSNGNEYSPPSIAPFTKAVVGGCTTDGNPNPDNFTGAATITSNVPVVAIGKVNGGGFSTAFVGSASGASKLALPYIRWPTDNNFNLGRMQRANLAIQNIGGSAITGNITVKYVNPDGTVAGTHTINTATLPGGNLAVGAKVNSNPPAAGLSEFGCYNSCTVYGGGAIVEAVSGGQLAVIARLAAYVPATGLKAGEDYNGIPYP